MDKYIQIKSIENTFGFSDDSMIISTLLSCFSHYHDDAIHLFVNYLK